MITWCVGHLVEMVYPEEYDERYKKWRLEDLPFLPQEYKYNVIPNVSRQYDVVHRMLHREDIETVYWQGDAGKEGQTIEENIRKFGGVREGMKELRVWIDSQTEERSCGASGRQRICQSTIIWQNPVSCAPSRIMPWELIFPGQCP